MKQMILALMLLLSICGCAPQPTVSRAPEGQPEPAPVPAAQSVEAEAFRYGYDFLDPPGKALYDALLDAVSGPEFSAAVEVPVEMDDYGVSRVAAYFYGDQPGIFWGRPEPGREGGARVLRLEGALSTAELEQRRVALQDATAQFLEGIEGDGFEAVAAIHDRLVEWVARDTYDENPDNGNVYGALVERSAICDGYARAFQYLLEERGIPCVYYSGTSVKGTPHAWNAFRLEGEWYYTDVTWDTLTPGRTLHLHLGITLEELLGERIFAPDQYPPVEADSDRYNYYRYHGSAVDVDGETTLRQLAEAFVNALEARPLYSEWRTEYLEVKIYGTPEQYEAAKRLFIRDVFPLLREMELVAGQRGLPMRISTEGQIRCNNKDAMQVLILLPVVREDP